MPSKTNLLRLLLIAAIILQAAPVVQAADWLSINGYYKSFFTAYDWPDVDFFDDDEYIFTSKDPTNAIVNNRLRLNSMVHVNDWLLLSAAYDFSPRAESDARSGTTTFWSRVAASKRSSYRVEDIRSRLYPGPHDQAGSFRIYQNLDRLSLTINSSFADFYIGRQAIAWGSARVINPTDILAPYAFNELDIEDRMGTPVMFLVKISNMQEAPCFCGASFTIAAMIYL